MGRWFARFLTEQGCTVLVSDRGTALSNRALARQCQIVVVCVPIRATPAVLAEIADVVRADALIVNTASLMLPSLAVMEGIPSELLYLHRPVWPVDDDN